MRCSGTKWGALCGCDCPRCSAIWKPVRLKLKNGEFVVPALTQVGMMYFEQAQAHLDELSRRLRSEAKGEDPEVKGKPRRRS